MRAASEHISVDRGVLLARLFVNTALWLLLIGALLLLPAGMLAWPAAWVLLAEMGVFNLATGLWLARRDPELLAERLSPLVRPDQKPWDRRLVIAFQLLWHAWWVVMGLDARLHGIARVSPWLQALGAAGVAASFWLSALAFKANRYASPVVRLQTERGQTLACTGPYRVVRHPMYAGLVLQLIGAPLLLGSGWGLGFAILLIALLALRAVLEERMLMGELDGYADYAGRVRRRIVPLVW
jgi:protein-S-isoprenylcysteine O-methyltransferase Ste14